MTNPIDVGTIIGGRYKVTGLIVSTEEGDDVLAGLDQVLNRSVSILVAAKKNASQAAQSGRELATGERAGSVQVLDMVIMDGRPALITNRSRADELLDLLVSQDKPYVEPFFTESLGSEIFGQQREATPEDDLEWDEHYYDLRDEKPLIDLSSMSERARARAAERAAARDAAAAQRAEAARLKAAESRRTQDASESASAASSRSGGSAGAGTGGAGAGAGAAGVGAAGAGASALLGSGSEPASSPVRPSVRPLDSDNSAGPSTQAVPQVDAQDESRDTRQASSSRGWFRSSEPRSGAGHAPQAASTGSSVAESSPSGATQAGAAAGAAAGLGAATGVTAHRPSVRPLGPDSTATAAQPELSAPTNGPETRALSHPVDDEYQNADSASLREDLYDEEEPEDESSRKGSRALVGALLALLLIGAVVFAVTQLSSLFTGGGSNNAQPSTSSASPSASSTPSQAPAAAPAISSVSRLVPSNPTLDAGSDVNLGRIIDGDPASAWGSLVYTNPQFGNLTQNFALVFELKSPAEPKRFNLTQRYGSGGAYEILVNDSPSLTGATKVGQGTFSSADVSLDLTSAGAKKYVIMNVTELPRLTGVQTVYPWGMVIAEVTVK